MRSVVMVLALLAASLPAAAQQDARVEGEVIRGATVTVEEGVRVIRPVRHQKAQALPSSGQSGAGLCKPTYLHRIGEAAGSGPYIRRVTDTGPLSGPR
jgi:hypothetical protein